MCRKIVRALVSGGADIIEIGIPFSDPIADGPSLQNASSLAIRRGITAENAMDLASDIRNDYSDLPLVAMTYSNIRLYLTRYAYRGITSISQLRH
jgi:tryptophan synthase alpha chain